MFDEDFEIEDVLTSTSSTNALSANMGRALKGLIWNDSYSYNTTDGCGSYGKITGMHPTFLLYVDQITRINNNNF